jgi:nucleoside phosphorylase
MSNIAFFEAAKRNSERINSYDIEKSAEEISRVRLEDMIKEYSDTIPGLAEMLNALSIGQAYMPTALARDIIESVALTTSSDRTAETIRLLGVVGVLHELHSIGFFGYCENSDGRFTFCHDGRLANIDFGADVELMIHPCYWRAINVTGSDGMAPEIAEEIHDDYNERYEVNVTSVALERRKELVQRLASEPESLPIGSNDEAFFAWAARALGTLLAAGIRDLERQNSLLHGRITSTKGVWGDIQDAHQANHLLFLLHNEDRLSVQAITDACAHAKKTRDSRVIFICTRAIEDVIRRGPMLEAVKQHYHDDGLIVVHITEKTICRSLRKLREPNSDNEPGRFVRAAIEQTVFSYVQSRKRGPRKNKGKRSVGITCDVLLVVATSVERDAILDQFRTNHGCTIDQVFAPRRTYFKISGINETKILLVQCEMGSGGIGASQATVRDAIDDLNPDNIVMVGIAFGMRPDKQEIGQILVSRQLRSYEMQRLGTVDGNVTCTLRGDRVTASSKLLGRFRAAEYGWPGKVSFGLLLSSEKLIDNEDYRKSLAEQEPEAIGGEMEGTGLYAAADDLGKDWIIVKAICDWADGNKSNNKDALQREAAAKSAAFVIHAISCGAFSRQNKTLKR